MVEFIAGLLIGLLIGGVGILFIRRNAGNSEIIDPIIDKVDDIIEEKIKKD